MRLEPLLRTMPFLASLAPRRSAGVRVTSKIHRQIEAGNIARTSRSWAAAAQAYDAALALDPTLVHIWIQCGHAYKEAGDFGRAASAYREAQKRAPDASEPHLHLGHLAKESGDPAAATRYYFQAARLQPPCPAAIAELGNMLAKGASIDMNQLADIIGNETQLQLRQPLDDANVGERSKSSVPGRVCLIFDISDLIAYFRHSRTPTGIQRVQVEVLREAFACVEADVRVCAFQEIRDEWVELSRELFEHLCALTNSDDDEEWRAVLAKATIHLGIADALAFPEGAFLVNLGTSWWIPNYFMYVRRAREMANIRYIPFVHDMIPLMKPDVCPPLLVRDFTAWVASVLENADFYLVNSNSTKCDLVGVSNYLGQPIDPQRVQVVRLDAVHCSPERKQAGPSVLARNGLRGSDYVLFVSTIEPRKNHIAAFDAWLKLIERHGKKKIPYLVCVGNSGWMNETVHDFLNARPELRMKVMLLSHLSDLDLAELYRGCLFTLYPSHYEGWGLPVTESLGHGKIPLCSNTSSIPEAGGVFADYFDIDSRAEFIAGAEKLLFDQAHRKARERQVAADFEPRIWKDIAQEIIQSAEAWPDTGRHQCETPPRIISGRYYPLSRNLAPRLWPGLSSTEGLRSGFNWWGPDEWGCWTKPGGAKLHFTVDNPERPHRLYLDLLSMPNAPCALRIDANGVQGLAECTLDPHERRWISLDVPGNLSGENFYTVELICSSYEDLSKITSGGDARFISVGVSGIFLCESDDAVSRMALLEAVTLSSIDTLSINRPPADFVSLAAFMEGVRHG